MAHNTNLSTAAANIEANAFGAALNNGYLRAYSGTQPVSSDTAITDQVLLFENRFAATAFQPAAGGTITSNPLTAEDSAPASGNATWFRLYQADGTTAMLDGSIGVEGSNSDLELPDYAGTGQVYIPAGAEIEVESFVHTVTK